jgi:hypothetical protein
LFSQRPDGGDTLQALGRFLLAGIVLRGSTYSVLPLPVLMLDVAW